MINPDDKNDVTYTRSKCIRLIAQTTRDHDVDEHTARTNQNSSFAKIYTAKASSVDIDEQVPRIHPIQPCDRVLPSRHSDTRLRGRMSAMSSTEDMILYLGTLPEQLIIPTRCTKDAAYPGTLLGQIENIHQGQLQNMDVCLDILSCLSSISSQFYPPGLSLMLQHLKFMLRSIGNDLHVNRHTSSAIRHLLHQMSERLCIKQYCHAMSSKL